MLRTARWLAFASSAVVVVGIAPSQIFLALALIALLLSGEELRLPPIKLPLALFLLGTVIAVIFSDDPAAGLPQIRKIYVFCQLFVVYSLLRDTKMMRWLVLTWAGLSAVSSGQGIIQFAKKVQQAHAAGQNFYSYYVGERITGLMSHWHTFSSLDMFSLLMLSSFLFFSPRPLRFKWFSIGCGLVIATGLLLAEMRGVWIASFVAGCYLVWQWRRRLLWWLPVAALAGIFFAPPAIRQRFVSILHPSRLDSNAFRIVTWRTGLRMIEAHPLLGLGPEMPRIEFDRYVPADIPRPLPEGSYIHLHNLYLHYAAERGIPTLLAFLWLMGKILRDFWRALQKLPPGRDERRFLLHGAVASALAVLVDGVANVNLGDSEILTMFLVIVAFGYLMQDQIASVPRPQPASAGVN